MDLASSIVGMKQAELTTSVQYAVARKVLDMQEYQGNAAVELIQAADQNFSQSADQLSVAATGLGSSLDVYG